MSDWRELIPENTINGQGAIIAKIAKTPVKSNIADIADIALRSNTQYLVIATKRLQQFAKELDWPADDLLNWYKADEDMKDIARLDLHQVRECIRFYTENYYLCREQAI